MSMANTSVTPTTLTSTVQTAQNIQLQLQPQQHPPIQPVAQPVPQSASQPISIALQQIPVSMLSIPRTQATTPVLTLSRGASPITISRGATPTPPASSASTIIGNNAPGNTIVAVSSSTGVLTLQNLQSIVNSSNAAVALSTGAPSSATTLLAQQPQPPPSLQPPTAIAKTTMISTSSSAPTSTTFATIRSTASSPVIPSPSPTAPPSSTAVTTTSAPAAAAAVAPTVTQQALLQQQRAAQLAQLQQQQRSAMMAQIVTVSSAAPTAVTVPASVGVVSTPVIAASSVSPAMVSGTLTSIAGQRVAVTPPTSTLTIQDLQRGTIVGSVAAPASAGVVTATSGATLITAEQAAAMQRLQVTGTAMATNVAQQMQQRQPLPQQPPTAQQLTGVKWNQLSSGVSTIAQPGGPSLILTKNGTVINRQQLQLRQQQLSAVAAAAVASSGASPANVIAANQPNLLNQQQQAALLQKQLASQRLQLATNKKMNLAAIGASTSGPAPGAAVITSMNPQSVVTPVVSGVAVSGATTSQLPTATRIDGTGELALLISKQQQQARSIAAGGTTQIQLAAAGPSATGQLSTAQLLQAQVMSSTGQAVSVGTTSVQLAGATTLVKSVVAPQVSG